MKHIHPFLVCIFLIGSFNSVAQVSPSDSVNISNSINTEIKNIDSTKSEPAPFIEVMPCFPGGEKKMTEFINKNIQELNKEHKGKCEGKVVVQYIINIDGTLEVTKILKSLSPECDTLAIGIIKKMPPWNPALLNGKAVPVYFNLPITFR